LFLFARFAPPSSDEDEEEAAVALLGVLVNRMVTNLTTITMEMMKMTQMCYLLVKNLTRILGLLVFNPLLELMLFKQTILNVTRLALILFDLPVI
jgi:hypothetical protein